MEILFDETPVFNRNGETICFLYSLNGKDVQITTALAKDFNDHEVYGNPSAILFDRRDCYLATRMERG